MALFYISCLFIGLIHFSHAMHGGKSFPIKTVPYVAQLNHVFETEDFSVCGAAILSEKWILTAAHCLHSSKDEDFLYTQVRVGTDTTLREGQLHNISRTITHKDYSWNTRWNSDISLIELAEPIEFNNNTQPIFISKEPPKVGSEVTVAGFGDDNDESVWYLNGGKQTVITRNKCRRAYQNSNHEAHRDKVIIDNRIFCVDSTVVDAGHGDSGSPVVLDGKIVGIVSEGGENPIPNIHVNVARYYPWITDTTGIKFD